MAVSRAPRSAAVASTLALLLLSGAARADDEDVVEIIEDGPAPANVRSAPAAAPPKPPEDRFEFSGWAIETSEVLLTRGTHTSDVTYVPRDAFIQRTQLLARGRYQHGRSFEVNVSGLASYTLLAREPGVRGPTPSLATRATRGEAAADLRDLYVGWYGKRIDLRLGQQRIAWGNGEFFAPNDVVNPRDLRDPFVGDRELTRLPSPAARLTADLDVVTVEAVFAPYFVPDRFDVFGTNWAAIQQDAPANMRALAGTLTRNVDPSLLPEFQRLYTATGLPARDLSAPVPQAKIAWKLNGWDLEHYYQYGFDGPMLMPTPAAAADPSALPLAATYVRRHHVGLASSVAVGSFVVRADASYQSNKVFYTRELLGFASPALQGVAGLEYQTGDPAKTAILEGFALRILDAPPPLLVYERTSAGVAAVVRWPIHAGFGIEPRAIAGLAPSTIVLQPQVTYKRGPLTLFLGGLFLDGKAGSFGAYYQHNTELYVKAKVAF